MPRWSTNNGEGFRASTDDIRSAARELKPHRPDVARPRGATRPTYLRAIQKG
jgi:hypothetical protein